MLVPFKVQKSALRFPRKAEYHLAVTWNDMTIVWATCVGSGSHLPYDVLFCYQSGQWIRRKTIGDLYYTAVEHVEVINDTLFVLDTFFGHVYSLDLNTWKWTKVSPLGNPPSPRNPDDPDNHCSGHTSWTYAGKIYCFGGEVLNAATSNQLFCYNTDNNTWEWPDQGGDIPSPRRDLIQ